MSARTGVGVRFLVCLVALAAPVGGAATSAWAQAESPARDVAGAATPALKTLVHFDGVAAAFPEANLMLDAAGNLLGTTLGGGAHGAGTAFEIVKTGATTYAAKPTILASFGATSLDGASPWGGLIADSRGNLYGTTKQGGRYNAGTVFKIAKTASGYAGAATILASLSFASGEYPQSSLVADRAGNLYGATVQGGQAGCPGGLASGCGTVFKIVRTATGFSTRPKLIARFDGADGQSPHGGLIFDAKGALIGAASSGGPTIGGALFELRKTATGFAAKPVTLAAFGGGGGVDGAFPNCTLVRDANGNLFGTADQGGGFNSGAVFELAKTATGYDIGATVVTALKSAQGVFPESGLIIDSHGDLFGTALQGGRFNNGSVFKVTKTATGYSATPTVLVSFTHADGATPRGRLVADKHGRLFGTTEGGGRFGFGTIYEITGAGYVAP